MVGQGVHYTKAPDLRGTTVDAINLYIYRSPFPMERKGIEQHYPVELPAMTETFRPAPISCHWSQVATEHLKHGECDWGMELKLFIPFQFFKI